MRRPARYLPRLLTWRILMALLFSCGLAGAAFAGIDVWTGGGPEGGEVWDVAADPGSPSTLYAAASLRGVFKSLDGGATWSPANDGLAVPGNRRGFAPRDLDVAGDGTVYVLSRSSTATVHKTTDGGASWTEVSAGLPDGLFLRQVVVDPTDSDVAFVVADGAGVFRTTDGGAQWSPINTGLPTLLTTALAVDPETPQNLYLGTRDQGVQRSLDGGATWAPCNGNLETAFVHSIAIDSSPLGPSVLYATAAAPPVWKSAVGDCDWDPSGAGLPMGGEARVLVSPTSPSTLFYGNLGTDTVFRSTDGGALWIEVPANLERTRLRSLALDPASALNVWAAAGTGIVRSVDGGDTWASANAGLEAYAAGVVVPAAESASEIMTGLSRSGPHASGDGGASWQFRDAGLTRLGLNNGTALARAPSAPETLYLGQSNEVFRTADGGQSWTSVIADPGPFGGTPVVDALAVAPSDPDHVLAGNLSLLLDGFPSTPAILESPDGGANWTALFTPPDNGLDFVQTLWVVVDPTDPARIYAASLPITDSGGISYAIYRSVDGGANWNEVLGDAGSVPSIALDPRDPLTLYVGLHGAFGGETDVYKSTDGGDTWADLETGLAEIWSVAVSPYDSSLFVGGDALYVSADGGETFSPFAANGLPDDVVYVLHVAAPDTEPPTILAATNAGIYSYTDLTIFTDGFESGDTTAWSGSTP